MLHDKIFPKNTRKVVDQDGWNSQVRRDVYVLAPGVAHGLILSIRPCA